MRLRNATAASPWRRSVFDSPEELLRSIRLGEDSALELKDVRFRGASVSEPGRDELADEIAAIANTREGVLVLGVDDRTREIVGIPIERLDAVERYVFEICNDSIEPPVHFLSFRIELPDAAGVLQPVLKVAIPRSLFLHRSPGGYFHRQGSSKRRMSTELLLRLGQQRSQARQYSFEEQPVPGTTFADLEPLRRRRFAPASDDVTTFKKMKLATDDETGQTPRDSCRHPDVFVEPGTVASWGVDPGGPLRKYPPGLELSARCSSNYRARGRTDCNCDGVCASEHESGGSEGPWQGGSPAVQPTRSI